MSDKPTLLENFKLLEAMVLSYIVTIKTERDEAAALLREVAVIADLSETPDSDRMNARIAIPAIRCALKARVWLAKVESEQTETD
jgi:hypothetical protein